ncbi:MAG: hypothetical protein ABSH01_17710 [Terriglobia bacterium]|jgi:hypothetical protein
MGITYWLFVVLVGGFLALEERLNHIAGLLAEINSTLRVIEKKSS